MHSVISKSLKGEKVHDFRKFLMVPVDIQKHSNRPHCLYLWFHHGSPVCSEHIRERECPYQFWNCPVKAKSKENIQPLADVITSQEQEKLSTSS